MRHVALVAFAVAACSRQPQRVVADLEGAGPVRFGMPVDSAMGALNDAHVTHDTATGNCGYLTAQFNGAEVGFMIEAGRVVRVDILDTAVASRTGARIGVSEDSLQTLYSHQLLVTPHKYSDGHYMIYVSPSDTLHRLVFETDGKHVTSWRSGLFPAVEYVERCS